MFLCASRDHIRCSSINGAVVIKGALPNIAMETGQDSSQSLCRPMPIKNNTKLDAPLV